MNNAGPWRESVTVRQTPDCPAAVARNGVLRCAFPIGALHNFLAAVRQKADNYIKGRE
jgi:hypothetical protein